MEEGVAQHNMKVTVEVSVHELMARSWLSGAGSRQLRQKYLKIYRQNKIYCQKLGRTVGFEFKTHYKLHVLVQQRPLSTLRIISELHWLLPMSQAFWEDFVLSLAFAEFPVINQKFILDKMSAPSHAETVSAGNVGSKIATPEVVSMDALATVPTTPRLPRPNPTHIRETQLAKSKKSKKEKEKKPVPVRASPRKHTKTKKQKKDKQLEKVVDQEAKEAQGTKDDDVEGAKPITRLPEYIRLWNGKEKVTKDPNSKKFTISTPLLPE